MVRSPTHTDGNDRTEGGPSRGWLVHRLGASGGACTCGSGRWSLTAPPAACCQELRCRLEPWLLHRRPASSPPSLHACSRAGEACAHSGSSGRELAAAAGLAASPQRHGCIRAAHEGAGPGGRGRPEAARKLVAVSALPRRASPHRPAIPDSGGLADAAIRGAGSQAGAIGARQTPASLSRLSPAPSLRLLTHHTRNPLPRPPPAGTTTTAARWWPWRATTTASSPPPAACPPATPSSPATRPRSCSCEEAVAVVGGDTWGAADDVGWLPCSAALRRRSVLTAPPSRSPPSPRSPRPAVTRCA